MSDAHFVQENLSLRTKNPCFFHRLVGHIDISVISYRIKCLKEVLNKDKRILVFFLRKREERD